MRTLQRGGSPKNALNNYPVAMNPNRLIWKGESAVAAAAYRSGEKITNEYDGLAHDYTRKGGIINTEILLPDHAPREYFNRSTL